MSVRRSPGREPLPVYIPDLFLGILYFFLRNPYTMPKLKLYRLRRRLCLILLRLFVGSFAGQL